MHRLEQADPHHLRDPARVVAVRLVDLLRRQQSLHVPRLHADHRQVCHRQCIDQPLRQRTSLAPIRPNVTPSEVRRAMISDGSVGTFCSKTTLPASSTMHTYVSLTDTSRPTKCAISSLLPRCSGSADLDPLIVAEGDAYSSSKPEPQPPRYTICQLGEQTFAGMGGREETCAGSGRSVGLPTEAIGGPYEARWGEVVRHTHGCFSASL
jgi:hypothetical protein